MLDYPFDCRREAARSWTAGQDERYATAAAEFGGAIERLARAYEAEPIRADLIQDIHVALWRSLGAFDGRCSLRTWVYRVAHNTAASHVQRRRRWRGERSAGLETLEHLAAADDPEAATGERQALERLMAIIQQLGPPDRQVRAALSGRPRRRRHRRDHRPLAPAPSPPRSTA